MSKLIFYVHSNYNSFALELDNSSKAASDAYIELISIFWEVKNGVIKIVPLQKMNNKTREMYIEFIARHKEKSPKLNRLQSSLEKISDNEHYFTSNKSEYSAKEILFISNLISACNGSLTEEEAAKKFTKLTSQQDSVFGKVLYNYELIVFDSSKRITIGESDRNKRICIFCENGMNTDVKTTFKLKAHAFSEALGNKSIVLNEECDACNSKFGSSIEEDLIKYLDIYRVFFKVKGKDGIPKLQFDNGAVQIYDEIMTVMSQDIEHDKETGSLKVLLKSNHELININIYKALCKYALSVIDKGELINLKETISWIKSNEETNIQLPKVAVAISNIFVDTPVLGLYVRKNDNYMYPHIISEFKFKSLVFVYLLPFSIKDKLRFSDPESYENFWNTFKHYSSIGNWVFNDFSSSEKSKFQFKIQINNKKYQGS